MPKYDFETLGKSGRSYDAPGYKGTEGLLRDYQGVPIEGKSVKNNRTGFKAVIDQILAFEDIAKQNVVVDLKQATQKWFIFEKLVDIFEDITYSIWDFLSWRKVKSSLTILGAIGGGVALGAALGTIVPGIGTFIGGAAGALITSGFTAIGGTLGVAILGGVFGSYYGKKMADKFFKFEKRFQPSRRFTRVINQRFGIDDDTIDRINAYLYNRKESTSNPIIRGYIKTLRKDFIYKATPESLGALIRFFIKELETLLVEEQRNDDLSQINNKLSDFVAIKDILLKIPVLDKLPLSQRVQLESLLNENLFKQNTIEKPDHSFDRSVTQPVSDSARNGMIFSRTPSASSISPVQSHQNLSADGILQSLSENGYQIREKNNSATNHQHAEYQLRTQNGSSYLTFELDMDSTATEITITSSATATLQEEIDAFVDQAKFYYAQTNRKEVTILSGGDDDYATHLFVALRKEGFLPALDIDEYPAQSTQRRRVLKQIEELTNKQRLRGSATFRPQPK